MSRVHTISHSADMVNLFSFWNLSNELLIRKAMPVNFSSHPINFVREEMGISILPMSLSPNPTSSYQIDLETFQEPIENWPDIALVNTFWHGAKVLNTAKEIAIEI